jgi:hypothetical protein
MMRLGWWTLSVEGIDPRDLTDESLSHIADLIREGNIEGQIVQDEDD